MLWMVAWVHLLTGQVGHGLCVDDKATVKLWVDYANAEFAGEIRHWVEPCGEDL